MNKFDRLSLLLPAHVEFGSLVDYVSSLYEVAFEFRFDGLVCFFFFGEAEGTQDVISLVPYAIDERIDLRLVVLRCDARSYPKPFETAALLGPFVGVTEDEGSGGVMWNEADSDILLRCRVGHEPLPPCSVTFQLQAR